MAKTKNEKATEALLWAGTILAVIAIIFGIVWGIIWFKKSMSYKFMYEPMVIETIHDTVKKECLNSK